MQSIPTFYDPNKDKAAQVHFDELSREQQRQAIYDLADRGFSDYGVACATRLSVEFIRAVLGERTR